MNLSELLDSKVEYEIKDDSAARFWANAEINGRIIGVFFYRDAGDRWELIFAEKGKDNPEKFWSHAASGSGGELKVFALVKDLLGEFLKRHTPKELYCSSTKSGNRSRLYEKLLSKIPGFSLEKEEKDDEIVFTLRKK